MSLGTQPSGPLKIFPAGGGKFPLPLGRSGTVSVGAMANFTPTLFLEGGARPLQQTDHSYQVTVGASDPNHTNVVPHKQKSPRAPQPWGRAVFSWNMPPFKTGQASKWSAQPGSRREPEAPEYRLPTGRVENPSLLIRSLGSRW